MDTSATLSTGGFQYTDTKLDFFPHTSTGLSTSAEGYIKAVYGDLGGGGPPSFKYVFAYLDHLGNIRLKYTHPLTGETTILEEDHYYPYGLKHNGYNGEHTVIAYEEDVITLTPVTALFGDSYKYKFGGKEQQAEFDINTYDFGARNYDPALGRWMNLDPITHHSQSPYIAFDNNPVYYTDPKGKSSEPPTKNIKVTTITSTVDKNNVTTITQTTYDNTYTKNQDGSMSVTESKSEISNTVSGDGKITEGTSVTTQTDSYNVGTDGQKNDFCSSSNSESAGSNNTHSAFGEWTEFVSDYNKNHNEVYNKDMINKGSEKTTNALNIGLAVTPIATLNKLKLTQSQQIALKGFGGYLGASTAGEAISMPFAEQISNNNNYLIIYGVQHTQNGSLIKAMKTPNGNGVGERKNVGPTNFQELWNGIKSLFR